ncbi:MAG: hypothetical protein RLZZ230_344 [Candidatus Parcubacteria bacterium]|jgi:hypothetical protein
MRSDFEHARVAEKIKSLKAEQEELIHKLERLQRDQQYEIERMRQDFSKQTSAIQLRKSTIVLELVARERDLILIDKRAKDTEVKEASAQQQAKDHRLKPHL